MNNNSESQLNNGNTNSSQGAVSGSACPLCKGTGVESRDYYKDDNVNKIVTIKEYCSFCFGSGVWED